MKFNIQEEGPYAGSRYSARVSAKKDGLRRKYVFAQTRWGLNRAIKRAARRLKTEKGALDKNYPAYEIDV
jgi:hypothetical protein